MNSVVIVGTGLIGASVGLALRSGGFPGSIVGIDQSRAELATALGLGAIDRSIDSADEERAAYADADVVVLAMPVLAILAWLHKNAESVRPGQLVTDVGSTKAEITRTASRLLPRNFLPGHPMAGKESGGASLAEGTLFRGATWIFTPADASEVAHARAWRDAVGGFGANVVNMDAERHDVVCAWVSHLPQMVSTAMAALLEDRFGDSPELRAIGGRALREMTRLGASPYSMWRDVAMTNPDAIGETLLALEQRLGELRENLKTPGLRENFLAANRFRSRL